MAAERIARGASVCVAGRAESAGAGAAALRDGGNAFDAVAAAGFMEAVIAPGMCGIGGYGASGVGYLAGPRRLVALDANAVAPQAATDRMFPTAPTRDPNAYKLLDDRHTTGPLAAAVPGVLAGLLTLQSKFGRLDRKAVIAPASRRAREGVRMTAGAALTWLTLAAKAEATDPPRRESVPALVRMPRLADALDQIADGGIDAFYAGPIGRAIVEQVRGLGGILTADDLASYHALAVDPVSVDVRGTTLATPPPASGGLSALQMVALADRLERDGQLPGPGTAPTFSAWLEVDKVVWEERLTTLADPRFMKTPSAQLLTGAHLDRLLERVKEGIARPGPGRLVAPDPLRGTSHIAAADAEGNVVAWTQTHGGGYGSKVMVKGTEIVLGHGMCRFEPRPGWANSVAPGKRPLHNMCPVVGVKDGRAVLALGAAGGRTIVNNVAAVAARLLVHGLSPEEALAAPRIQCETLEPAVLERSAGAPVFEALRQRGHSVREANRDAGTAHLIARQGETWVGLGEPRLATASAVVA